MILALSPSLASIALFFFSSSLHCSMRLQLVLCSYINQVTHSVGYPRFVFTNNTPYGRPSNNNILVRLDTFCSVRRETTHQPDAKWWCDPHRLRFSPVCECMPFD